MTLTAAIKLARANPVQGLPRMAAIIYQGKRVVSSGLNSRRSHPLALKFSGSHDKICQHAELSAIVNARGYDLSGTTMYVARVFKDGRPALAKPCPSCQAAILAFGISDIFWTE